MNCIEIPILEDDLPEGEEQFIVTASAVGQDAPRVVVSVSSTVIIIEDNDGPGRSLFLYRTQLQCIIRCIDPVAISL